MNQTSSTKLRLVNSLGKLLAGALVLMAFSYLVIVGFVILSRIAYPYELDGIEGEGLVQVQRILAGMPLYARPTVEYVALIYPPLYYYAAALVSKLTVISFPAMRSVSLFSSMVCVALLFFMVRDGTKKTFPAVLAVGCFTASFIITDQWFDIARTDMLATALCFLGIFLVRERSMPNSALSEFASGVAFSLAFLTKQQELFVFLILLLYFGVTAWRTALRLAIGFVISTAFLFGLFWWNSQGWFFYYFFSIPSSHKFNLSLPGLIGALTSQFRPVPGYLLVSFLPLILHPREVLEKKSLRLAYAIAIAMIGAGTIGFLNKFAGRNVMVITYLGVSLLLGLAADWWLEQSRRSQAAPIWQFSFSIACLVLIAQFGLQYSPYLTTKLIPTQADQAIGDSLVSSIRDTSGNVLAIDENYLLIYAGKPVFYSEMAMSEVEGEGSQYSMPEWNDLQQQIINLIHAKSTGVLYVDYYARLQKTIAGCSITKIRYPDKSTFLPVTGFQTRPNFIISCNQN